jgi:MFS family permease
MKFKYTITFVFVSIFLTMISQGIINVVLPLYLNVLGISLVSMGLIFSLAPIIGIIAKSIVAVHSDVVGRKGYFSLTFLLRSISYGFYSICTVSVGFAILKTLDSLSQYFRTAVEMPLLVDVSPKETLGHVLGAYWAILSVATAGGLFISGVILLLIGYFWLFLLCSLISLVGLVLFQIARIPTFKAKNVHFNLKKLFNLKELSWNLKVLFIMSFILSFAFSMVELFAFPLFLQQDFGADSTLIGMAIGLGWLLQGIPAIVWRKMTETYSPVKLYFLGAALTGLVTIFMSATPDLISTIFLYILSGLFWGLAGPANLKVLADSANSSDRARDISLSGLGNGIGMMTGSIMSGVIAQLAGFRPLFIITGTLYSTCALIYLLAIRGYK